MNANGTSLAPFVLSTLDLAGYQLIGNRARPIQLQLVGRRHQKNKQKQTTFLTHTTEGQSIALTARTIVAGTRERLSTSITLPVARCSFSDILAICLFRFKKVWLMSCICVATWLLRVRPTTTAPLPGSLLGVFVDLLDARRNVLLNRPVTVLLTGNNFPVTWIACARLIRVLSGGAQS